MRKYDIFKHEQKTHKFSGWSNLRFGFGVMFRYGSFFFFLPFLCPDLGRFGEFTHVWFLKSTQIGQYEYDKQLFPY